MTIESTQSVDSIVYPVPVSIIIESNGLFNYEFAILSHLLLSYLFILLHVFSLYIPFFTLILDFIHIYSHLCFTFWKIRDNM